MIRKATALALLFLLGLYMPAVALPACVCISPAASLEASCGTDAEACCDSHEADASSCCGDPECCIVVIELPDGIEPKASEIPGPLTAPLPVVSELEIEDVPRFDGHIERHPDATKAPPGAPIRIAYGVWRL